MSVVPMKAVLTTAGISGVGLGGYGIYHLTSSGETIGEKVISSLKGTKKRFLKKGDTEWSGLQDKYNSLPNKPRVKGGSSDLPFSDLPDWCDKHYKETYSKGKEGLYSKVSIFCFFNTNTVIEELVGRSLISNGRDDVKWQTAWETYNTTKTQKKLEITVTSGSSKLNESDKVEGGKALYDWCSSASQKKMYSVNIDSLFPRFEAWCINKE
ncbi:hypothetical protein MHF_0714 [Mycoplasma haemofelis Ohio2]|uniref:Uncharacterized protein n=1 Tax=Mycoplasma haemofelis (strain Ohio2) TaxID=859194 RepID=F6FID6_MYCHI|nr:hypothetical protein MHF_0714 [Mycoplasma haemofelis Ohio2]